MESQKKRVQQAASRWAHRIRATRLRMGLSQAELASRSGLTPAAISQLENGQREPSFSTLVRLSEALETSPNDLMGAEEKLDPELQVLFRDLKDMDAGDLEKVVAFAKFIAVQDT